MGDNLPGISIAIVFEPHLKFGRWRKGLGTLCHFPIISSPTNLSPFIHPHTNSGDLFHPHKLTCNSTVCQLYGSEDSIHFYERSHMCWESFSLEALVLERPRPWVVAFMEKGRWETRWYNRVAVMKWSPVLCILLLTFCEVWFLFLVLATPNLSKPHPYQLLRNVLFFPLKVMSLSRDTQSFCKELGCSKTSKTNLVSLR